MHLLTATPSTLGATITYSTMRLFCICFLSLFLSSCIGGGTHGSIKAYRYPVSKFILDSSIQHVFAINPNIQRDTVKDYYNDGHVYVTMDIKQLDKSFRYTYRYAGDSIYWDISDNSSELFICYAWDQDGKGGSEGNGGVKWYNFRLKQYLLSPFESEFIFKIDSILKVKHSNPD